MDDCPAWPRAIVQVLIEGKLFFLNLGVGHRLRNLDGDRILAGFANHFRLVFEMSSGIEEGLRIAALACDNLRSEEHTSELQSHVNLVCRLLLEKKKKKKRA